jgi:adenylate kinase family enzyme
MLNLHKGRIIAKINGGNNNGRYIYIDDNYNDGANIMETKETTKIIPMMDYKSERSICYVAGPSGSGKSTYCANIIKEYIKLKKNIDIYIFSRTEYKNDSAYKNLKMIQIEINEELLTNGIDIEKEIRPNSIMLFDDINTIQNENLKKYMEKLITDIMEVGRKLKINCIVTNHLIIPNERKYARILLNEIQYLTVYPKSGSSQQISYVLKTYFGLTQKQIKTVLKLNSRWVTICKMYPITVISENGVYII